MTRESPGATSQLSQLRDYGILVVTGGELEVWLKHLGATGEKSKWLIETFELMGASPEEDSYVKPSQGDVWDFIGHAKAWLANVNRKGIPV